MSVKIAVTFGIGYGPNKKPHPVFPDLEGVRHFIVVEGHTRTAAVAVAFRVTGGIHAFDYLYEVDGVLDEDFQRQIRDWNYTEYVMAGADHGGRDVDAEIVESLRRQSEFYAANPRVDAGPDVETVECVYCDEPIDPEREDGDTAFDCQCCGNGWHHYDRCANSCSAYLDDLNTEAALDAAMDARAGA